MRTCRAAPPPSWPDVLLNLDKRPEKRLKPAAYAELVRKQAQRGPDPEESAARPAARPNVTSVSFPYTGGLRRLDHCIVYSTVFLATCQDEEPDIYDTVDEVTLEAFRRFDSLPKPELDQDCRLE